MMRKPGYGQGDSILNAWKNACGESTVAGLSHGIVFHPVLDPENKDCRICNVNPFCSLAVYSGLAA